VFLFYKRFWISFLERREINLKMIKQIEIKNEKINHIMPLEATLVLDLIFGEYLIATTV
jgi:hypothetical protein